MTLNRFFQWGFELLIVGSAVVGVDSLKDLSKSINELNVKIGVVIERTDGQQKRLDNHEERIHVLETKK